MNLELVPSVLSSGPSNSDSDSLALLNVIFMVHVVDTSDCEVFSLYDPSDPARRRSSTAKYLWTSSSPWN